MNRKLFERIEELFKERIYKKTGWGKNDIMREYDKATTEALFELSDGKL